MEELQKQQQLQSGTMSFYMELECKFELRDPVTPYICSTPADFEDERDWLAEHVFPKLMELCIARGTYFAPVDVRWSQQDSLAKEGFLLQTLLDLIKRSSPYFLCLLGETYGPYYKEDQHVPGHADNLRTTSDIFMDWLEMNMAVAARGGYPWIMQDGHNQCSIPELEILAATVRGQSHQCTFYFRQAEHIDLKFPDLSYEQRLKRSAKYLPESSHADLKIQSLKQTIVKRGLPVRYFKSLEELGEIVLKDWKAILDADCPPLYRNGYFLDSQNYQLWICREALLTRLRRDFVPSPDTESIMATLSHFVLSAIDEPVQNFDFDLPEEMSAVDVFRKRSPQPPPSQTILVLSGDRGVGKSALLAQWLSEFAAENPGLFLIHHFMSAAPGDKDISAFLRRCTRGLRKHFLLSEVTGYVELDDSNSWWSEEDKDTPEDFHSLCQAFVAAIGLGPCILLLDGINDMAATTCNLSLQEVKEFDWLPTPLPQHCRIILSTSRADLTYRCLCRRADVNIVTLPGLKHSSQKLSILTKSIRPDVLPRVKNQTNLMDMRWISSPLALCVLGTELSVPTNFQDLEDFVDDHYKTGALRTFWTHTLQQWVLQHSWPREDEATSVTSKDDGNFDYTGWVADALCLLSVSRGGLLQGELLQLLCRMGYAGNLEVTTLHWLRFRLRVGTLLWEASNGCIRFSHQHLQDMTEYTLLRSVSSGSSELDPSNQLPHQNSKRKVHQQLAIFFAQQPLSWRQAQELPWHLTMCGDLSGLQSYLTHSRVAHLFLARRSQYPDTYHDLQVYWNILEKHGFSTGLHYMTMLKDLGLNTLPAPLPDFDGKNTAVDDSSTVENSLHSHPGITVPAVTTDNSNIVDNKITAMMITDDHIGSDIRPTAVTFNTADTSIKCTAKKIHATRNDKLTTDPMQHKISASSRPGSGDTPPKPKLSWGTQQGGATQANSAGWTDSERLSVLQSSESSTSLRKNRSVTLQREPETSKTALEEIESSEDRIAGRRPLSSPCSYRLSPEQMAMKKEDFNTELSSRGSSKSFTKRKVSSAPGRRVRSASRKQSSLVKSQAPSVASPAPCSVDNAKSNTQLSSSASMSTSQLLLANTVGSKLKMPAASHKRQVDFKEQGKVFRPLSVSHPRSSTMAVGQKQGVCSSGFVGFFLTAADTHFSCSDLLDGMDPEQRKEALAELSMAVGWFLEKYTGSRPISQTHHHPALVVYTALLSFLQASYPLSVNTQLLVVRVMERVGVLREIAGDVDGARDSFHQALRVTFDLDALDENLCDHRQVDTFKGVLLGHHGRQHLADGDVGEGGELLKEATESISHLTGNHILRASLLLHLGLYRAQLGELTRSQSSLRQCLALRQQWHGQRHPEVAEVLLALARVLSILYRSKHSDLRLEAECLYRKALAVSEQCLGPTHLQVADILEELGELVSEEEARKAKMEARKLLQRSLDIRTTVLGADNASTKAARRSIRRVDLSLQLGQSDSGCSSSRAEYISFMPQRDMRLHHMGSRSGFSSRAADSSTKGELGRGMDIRSVSREKVLQHNRPDSMMSSAMSLMTASERLLISRPLSSKSKLLRLTSAASSRTGGGGGSGRPGSMNLGWSAKSMPVEIKLARDQEETTLKEKDRGEERGGGGVLGPRDPAATTVVVREREGGGRGGRASTRSRVLELDLGETVIAGKQQLDLSEDLDTPHLDSFTIHLQDGTIIFEEKPATKATAPHTTIAKPKKKVRPQSTPYRLFEHYANLEERKRVEGRLEGPGQGRPTWSARTTTSSTGSHVSRCTVPGPHDFVPGHMETTLSGPHTDISSLLGPPACPRDNVYPEVHHKSAFYHVPGRYATRINNYPARRNQKTEGARFLQSAFATKLEQANPYYYYHQHQHTPTLGIGIISPTNSAAPRALGVNQHDVTVLVREKSSVSRPESKASAILAAAGQVVDGHPQQGLAGHHYAAAQAVTFSELISVS